MNVYLTKPKLEDEKALREYVSELTSIDDGEGANRLYSYIMDDLYPTWVEDCQKNNADTFLIMNDLGVIVGIINIRYKLSRSLERCGGHVGYNIRPSMRRKGYATAALKQILYVASRHNLDELYIDCYKDNVASSKTIEAVGGVLIREEYNEGRNQTVLRYKVDLRDLKVSDSYYKSAFSRIDRIPKVVKSTQAHSSKSMISVEEYFDKKRDIKARLALEYLKELLKINPDLRDEMISPDLRKYLGIAKRECKKEEIVSHKRM